MSDEMAVRAGSGLIWQAVERFGGRVLSLLRVLVLARLLVPEDFGVIAIGVVVTELALSTTNLGMSKAVIQQTGVDEKHYDTAWTINLARGGLIAAVLLIVAGGFISRSFGEPGAAVGVAYLGTRPLIDALGSAKMPAIIRSLEFKRLALIRLTGPVVEFTVAVIVAVLVRAFGVVDPLFGISTDGVAALIAGALFGSAAQVAMSYMVAPHRPRFVVDRAAARQLLNFGRWLLVASLTGVLANAALRAIISRRFGVLELGVFYVAVTLATTPGETVGSIVNTVTFPAIAKVQASKSRTRRAFQAALVAIALPTAAAYAALIVVADTVSTSLLGPRWVGAASVIRIIAIAGIADVLRKSLRPALRGVGRPAVDSALGALRSLVLLILVLPMTDRWGIDGAAYAWLTAEVVTALAGVFAAHRITDGPFRSFGGRAVVITGAALAAGFAAWVVDVLSAGVIGLVITAGCAALASLGATFVLDRVFKAGVGNDVAAAFPSLGRRLGLGDGGR